jgi:acetyl esterase/lipase
MKALKAMNQISAGQTSLTAEDLKRQRNAMEKASRLATPAMGVTAEKLSVSGIPAEWIRPDFTHNTKSIILYCHGGGYTCGELSYARILAAKLALHTGLDVLSFAYRLAPEHPYPAPFEDGMAVWDFLMHQGYGAYQVLLAGDSAGGNLALTMTQHLASEGRKLPRTLLLFSPWTDMTAISESYQLHKKDDPILSYDYIISVRNAYAGAEADFSKPEYSPLYGNLANFPPTLIQVGEHEILQDDSNKLAAKLQQAGCQVCLQKYEDGWHVFQQMPVPLASQAMKAVGEYVQNILYKG